MFRIIGSTLAAVGLLLGASQAAEAHGTTYRGHDSSGYHHGAFHRKKHMPRWLWNKRAFRHWYFQTPLRFDRRLAWWQLHDAYRWERRHNRLRYGARNRYYDRNGRYWRDDDRRERRSRQRRRHRDN